MKIIDRHLLGFDELNSKSQIKNYEKLKVDILSMSLEKN